MTEPDKSLRNMKRPLLQSGGIALVLGMRYLYMAIFMYGFVHKIMHGWLWTGIMEQHFFRRLTELDPGSFQAAYLQAFAIPFAIPIAWIVTIGELVVGLSMLLGVATRINALFGLFMLLNFAAGGYYNWTIPVLVTMSILIAALPTGHWFGLDRSLDRKHPESPCFK